MFSSVMKPEKASRSLSVSDATFKKKNNQGEGERYVWVQQPICSKFYHWLTIFRKVISLKVRKIPSHPTLVEVEPPF